MTTNVFENPSKNLVLIGIEDLQFTAPEEDLAPETAYKEKKPRPQTASCINIQGV